MMAQKLPHQPPTVFQIIAAALAVIGYVAAPLKLRCVLRSPAGEPRGGAAQAPAHLICAGAGRTAAADRWPAEPWAAGDHGHVVAPADVGNDADESLAGPGTGVINAAPDALGAADVERIRAAAGLRCAIVRRAPARSRKASTASLSGALAVWPAHFGGKTRDLEVKGERG